MSTETPEIPNTLATNHEHQSGAQKRRTQVSSAGPNPYADGPWSSASARPQRRQTQPMERIEDAEACSVGRCIVRFEDEFILRRIASDVETIRDNIIAMKHNTTKQGAQPHHFSAAPTGVTNVDNRSAARKLVCCGIQCLGVFVILTAISVFVILAFIGWMYGAPPDNS